MAKHRKDPFQSVVEATLQDEKSGRFWCLVLACGHEDTRPVAYVPTGKKGGRGGARNKGPLRSLEDLTSAPKRVRCDLCR